MRRNLYSESASWRRDIAQCRSSLASGSRSFFAASFLLPKRVREPATALYAFCRLADDCIDKGKGGPREVDAIRARLDRLYGGSRLDDPADRALAAVVGRHAIPRALPEALLEGLEWDASGRRYASLAELKAYSARVAGSVGVMMALLMGVRSPELLARAADLGVAMQLTNIARDVGEDARAGRVYLPLEWLDAAGIDADALLARPAFTPALGLVIARVLDAADRLYRHADMGIAALPADCRLGIAAARLLYAGIGEEVRRNGLDSISRRAVVPARRKATLLFGGVAKRARHRVSGSVECLAQTKFLVDAALVGGALSPSGAVAAPAWWDVHGRAVWVIDLFERLQRRQIGDEGPETVLEQVA